jgi:hypothetical protein
LMMYFCLILRHCRFSFSPTLPLFDCRHFHAASFLRWFSLHFDCLLHFAFFRLILRH